MGIGAIMIINKIQTNDSTFKAGRLNVLAIGDSHGNVARMPKVLKTIENNAKDIFPKTGYPSTLNVFANVGDWFINPSKKGFLTNPKLSNGDIQNLILLRTLDSLRDLVSSLGKKSDYVGEYKNTALEVLYTLGNHCLDGGTKFMLNVMRKNPMITLVTNMDLSKSTPVRDAMKTSDNITKSVVYSIPDDKNPKLFHKVLFLGVTIPSMDFYNPGLCEGLEFYDNSNKKDANIREEDLQGTIQAVRDEVDKFKAENPKGAVIVLSHMGGRLSEMLQKNVPQINHILNGHDHKNTQSNVGKTSINSLGKDNEMVKALNFEFDDSGNLVRATMTPYFTETTLDDGLENHPLQIFLNECFREDMKPIISLDELKTDNVGEKTADLVARYTDEILNSVGINTPELKEKLMSNKEFEKAIMWEVKNRIKTEHGIKQGLHRLSYGNEIRYKNSYLMNYLTSALKRNIRDKIDPNVFTVALQSSIVRGGLANGSDNLAVMKIFDGVSEDLSGLKIGNVKGEELVGLITENILGNLKAPTRNTIIHWSDVQVNRSLIEAIHQGKATAKYSDAVRVRNPITKQFEPIDLDEEYRMVIGEKFLVKDDIKWPGIIRDRFEPLNKTYDEIFRDYITSINYELHITPKTKEERIL